MTIMDNCCEYVFRCGMHSTTYLIFVLRKAHKFYRSCTELRDRLCMYYRLCTAIDESEFLLSYMFFNYMFKYNISFCEKIKFHNKFLLLFKSVS